jgi:hypothetical protein
MIGVIANPADHDVVRELFELFKTPWEFHRSRRHYEVVLCAGPVDARGVSADLVVVYGSRPTRADVEAGMTSDRRQTPTTLAYRGRRIPIHGTSLTFRADDVGVQDEASGRSVACVRRFTDGTTVRVGYDLFREIRLALTEGQPAASAALPSVDLHIGLLRDLILEWGSGAPLIEIPPVPAGHPFIVCLTHDLDHPSIRRHRWDHTTLGFLYRALVGSAVAVARGRAPLRNLLRNWAAAMRLPLVHAGVAKDFWADFDRYLELEDGLASTFFVIPFEGVPGRLRNGPAPARRAARYGARDIAVRLRRVASAGGEIGVHGLDAWRDSMLGRRERDEVATITGAPDIGVRMHWLYGDEHSPATLEKAGFAYDSTSGYNETVGYRAGTTQVFKPLNAVRLLELPLHVMDTALFYPKHLHLSPRQALARVRGIVDHARQLGGTVTINWHDRSIAPERLWGDVYVRLLQELEAEKPWFATAGQAVAWFRKRRSVVFEAVSAGAGAVRATLPSGRADGLPGVRLRVHGSRGHHDATPASDFVDVPLEAGRGETAIAV